MHPPIDSPITADLNSHAAMVLLVDDQVMVAEAIRRALSTEGNIDFHYCSDPYKALTVAIQTRPTVILQDLVLPGVDGLSLVKEYRNHPVTRDIPIIVLSTKEDPAIKSAAFSSGANDYLVKLPDSIELVARIRYHSRSYLALVQRDEAYQALRQSQQQLLESNMELRRLTNSDGLTGLGNRRYFDEYLNAEWQRARRDGREISMLMIDVDHFKSLTTPMATSPATKRSSVWPTPSSPAATARPTWRRASAARNSPWCCPARRPAARGWWPRSCAARWKPCRSRRRTRAAAPGSRSAWARPPRCPAKTSLAPT